MFVRLSLESSDPSRRDPDGPVNRNTGAGEQRGGQIALVSLRIREVPARPDRAAAPFLKPPCNILVPCLFARWSSASGACGRQIRNDRVPQLLVVISLRSEARTLVIGAEHDVVLRPTWLGIIVQGSRRAQAE